MKSDDNFVGSISNLEENTKKLNENAIELINTTIKNSSIDTNKISDGYHTFGELYEHRIILYLSLIGATKAYIDSGNRIPIKLWYSDTHHDGTSWDGWLIVGITNTSNNEQISYHINSSYEHLLIEMDIEKLDKAPEWDGHTSEDVLKRLIKLYI